jgi:acyl carrier protein
MNDALDLDALVRGILRDQGRLSRDVLALGLDDDLYQAGMTSHAAVNVMLALEDSFEVEFPDHLLTRSTFASLRAIEDALGRLREPR